MDRGARWALVHGVSKSWDRTEWWTLSLSWVFQLLKAPTKWKKKVTSLTVMSMPPPDLLAPKDWWCQRWCSAGRFFTSGATREAPGNMHETLLSGYFREELPDRIWGNSLLRGRSHRSCLLCVHFQKCGLQLSWVFLSYSVMNMWFINIHMCVYIYIPTQSK